MNQLSDSGGITKRFLYRQRFGYGMGDFACNLIWQVISLYLLYFYTDIVHLDAKSIAAMFVVCRVIDAITDVLVGFAIDKTRTRWGRASRGFYLERFLLQFQRFWHLEYRTFHRMENWYMPMRRIFFCLLCIRL